MSVSIIDIHNIWKNYLFFIMKTWHYFKINKLLHNWKWGWWIRIERVTWWRIFEFLHILSKLFKQGWNVKLLSCFISHVYPCFLKYPSSFHINFAWLVTLYECHIIWMLDHKAVEICGWRCLKRFHWHWILKNGSSTF